jgi:hypothetical protein
MILEEGNIIDKVLRRVLAPLLDEPPWKPGDLDAKIGWWV